LADLDDHSSLSEQLKGFAMSQWVVVVSGNPTPSVVGPFDTMDQAISFADSIQSFAEAKIATLNSPPER